MIIVYLKHENLIEDEKHSNVKIPILKVRVCLHCLFMGAAILDDDGRLGLKKHDGFREWGEIMRKRKL